MRIENNSDQLMCMAAHRYCLGRKTYVVSVCVEWLRETWPQIDGYTQGVVLRDTIEAIVRDRAGDSVDRYQWIHFLRWSLPKASDETVEWLKNSINHMVKFEDFIMQYLEGKKEETIESS